MALFHEVPFGTMREVAASVLGIYAEHGARDPVPEWYESLQRWYRQIEEQDGRREEGDPETKILLRTEAYLGGDDD